MRFKTIRHKEQTKLYAHIQAFENDILEVVNSEIPELLPIIVTKESFEEQFKNEALLLEQLNKYELVEISLFIIER